MDLTDGQWALLVPVLAPTRRADGRGRPWQDARGVLNGVLWVLRTGAPWRDLPDRYPPYQTCHRRLQQWQRSRGFLDVMQRLAEDLRDRGTLDLTEGFIDASFTPAKKGLQDRPPSRRRAERPSIPPSAARRYWNRIPSVIRQRVVDVALAVPERTPRELAWQLTDREGHFLSESSVYRILKAFDLITSPAFVLLTAGKRFSSRPIGRTSSGKPISRISTS